MATLNLSRLMKSYGGAPIVRGINLEIEDHEFIVLVGPSGCGKSTTLRMIAGLETPTGGDIMIQGKRVNDLPPSERNIAMVFQNYALYPHMSCEKNITFGLRQQKLPAAEIARRLEETSEMLGIKSLLARKPRQLSGGQRQRVAIGRALVRNPEIFLFDEPLSNLDAKLRTQMRTEIKRLHQLVPTTTVYVTHDQTEAMTLADRVIVMNNGRIEQAGPPQELYHAPATRFVAGFIGSPAMNFWSVQVGSSSSDTLHLSLGDHAVSLSAHAVARYRPFHGRQMIFGIRPEHLGERAVSRDDIPLPVLCDVVEPMGADTMVHFTIAGQRGVARLGPDCAASVGQSITLFADMRSMHLIDPVTDQVMTRDQ